MDYIRWFGTYTYDYIIWQYLFFTNYCMAVFRTIQGCSYTESKIILWSLIIVSAILCLVQKKYRTWTNMFVSTLLPLEIYTMLSFGPYFQVKSQTIMLAAGLSLAGYAFLMFDRKIKNTQIKGRIIKRRIGSYIYHSKVIVAVCLAFFMVPISGKLIMGKDLFEAKMVLPAGTQENPHTIAANIDTVCKLQEDVWGTLSPQEKMEVLQTVANIEANYLGLKDGMKVVASSLESGVLGLYNSHNHQITVELNCLDTMSAHKVLDVICHEAYHGYEHRLVDLYNSLDEEERRLLLFTDAEDYRREFVNYTTGVGYYSQKVEKHSRDYAEDAVKDYYDRIEKHLKETSVSDGSQTTAG